MDRSKKTWTGLLAAGLLQAILVLVAPIPGAAQPAAKIRSVRVLNQGSNFELEIEGSKPLTPKTQVITGPDRLIIDFAQAVPGPGLRPLIVKTSQVKGVRTGLFQATPPTARIVLDLNGPQPYQVFPSGNKVIVKLISGNPPAAAAAAGLAALAPVAPPPPPQPHAEVELKAGKLSIRSDRATLADILHEVQRRTGASLFLAPGLGQEAVVTQLGPASVRDVLTKLLDGSDYNVVLVGAGHDWSAVTSIMLTAKGSEGVDMPANFAATSTDQPPIEQQAEPPLPDPPPAAVDIPPDTQQPSNEVPPPPPDIPPPPQ